MLDGFTILNNIDHPLLNLTVYKYGGPSSGAVDCKEARGDNGDPADAARRRKQVANINLWLQCFTSYISVM